MHKLLAKENAVMGDPAATPQPRNGLPLALAAYTIWGVFPLYLVLLNAVNPFALVGWRIIWTLPLCAAMVAVAGQWPAVKAALRNRRVLLWMGASSVLISVNWLVYVVAVQRGYFYAASLGYYINPLVNVLLGTIMLKERLGSLQWIAVGLAAVGVGVLAWEAEATLIISLVLAISFSGYGLIRKIIAVDALPGLTIEVVLLALPAAIAIAVAPPGSASFGSSTSITLLLMGAGVMTAVPLLLFAAAARRMPYSALGFVQFIAPTIVFLLGMFVFDQPLNQAQLVCFVFIWIAIALFCTDILRRGNLARRGLSRL
ncbi:EamA family transporter RarD [Croceicoccus sp. F390]|uniref:EamA family transporter RarD n=1 Tax=Croceicoccus esteveae TaxID=3075597 RepID=A0ABU2ZFF9_9SPHN|nr:EamA family transporter RarD [Croceicoccus sp. F390]MDT0575333.1 EamA family transporter RarD [Croceicoccus sp. F390]